jgi:hypothetical protein
VRELIKARPMNRRLFRASAAAFLAAPAILRVSSPMDIKSWLPVQAVAL